MNNGLFAIESIKRDSATFHRLMIEQFHLLCLMLENNANRNANQLFRQESQSISKSSQTTERQVWVPIPITKEEEKISRKNIDYRRSL